MLILVRHGQTSLNAAGRLVGRLDPPLTDLGRRQAMALSAAVAGAHRVVASPLARAFDTAALLGLGEVEVDERWIELDYGDFDGVAFGDVPADVWRQWRADSAFAPPGGESLDDVGARVAGACRELLVEAAEHDVVVVSHVSPIKAAAAWALQVEQSVAFRMHLENASITRLGVGPAGPVLRSFNETAHLSALR
ncbi:MAG TPA: histidine phosphatase family protein [Acidimicrobiales bacterium]|nr:histidine phosphatase family protein [Acidimicrobiales bacterium]